MQQNLCAKRGKGGGGIGSSGEGVLYDPDFLMVADDHDFYRSCVQSPGVEMKGLFPKLQVHIQEIRYLFHCF
ncbi:hypothetical protein EUTSA_v10029108mg [Eutrema salsugineum]|uniref:Uncharacterized protein n=2 Tax=Eutrema salsugineum TaxID=72664 RepID=V4LG49_EUTSA|nr:hypothetical protein EUTSA_v10029108mg [Eutrema salsugineum]